MKKPASFVPLLAACLAASLVTAQDDAKGGAPAMPNPKHPEHATLLPLCGDWEFTMKMAGMPGVPGMEKAAEATGREHTETICNGLWLKSSIQSTWQGQPFEGVWLAGYDPFGKHYTSYWFSSDEKETAIAKMDGSYDDKTKTWTWRGKSPAGEMRSVFVFKGDSSVETAFVKGPDGKETQVMEFVRKRMKAPAAGTASDASARPAPKLGKEHQALQQDVGTWTAVVKSTMPGAPATEERATETVLSTCNGRWTWSNFQGRMMGQPFEGHAICGYDPQQQKYLCLWIDSMSPTAAETSGTHDEKKGVLTLTGECLCPEGKPMKMAQTLTRQGADKRVAMMTFTTAGQTSTMEITYQRQAGK
jgi:hypothetical protein